MRCPIECCCVTEFSNLLDVRNGFEYYESTRYVVRMTESKRKEYSISSQSYEMIAYLDSKSMDGGDNTEGTSQNAVVSASRVVFPDGCCRFDSRDLCYMFHNVHVAKVHNVCQAAVGGFSNIAIKTTKRHTVIVVRRGPGGCE